jgi:adenylate kinase
MRGDYLGALSYLCRFYFDLKLTGMLNIVLFGPPGAGKGTQSENLIKRYDLVHLSTGDIFRSNIKGGTELGIMAKQFIDQGALVPDEVTIGMLRTEVVKLPNAKGFIFDGFPRTTAQAEALDAFLSELGTEVTCMLALEVPEHELRDRLKSRAETSGRSDDADPTIIANRIATYHRETSPVADYYKQHDKYFGINGLGDIQDIAERLYNAIDAHV